jgi:preprotein translocase subunit SecF
MNIDGMKSKNRPEARSMGEHDPRRASQVQLSLVEYIDRALEVVSSTTEANFRRCEAAIEAQARAENLRHEAGDAKIQKANEVLDYRLEEMNNFRAQINQERTDYVRREMYEREHNAVADRVKTLEIVRGEQSGKTAAYASMVGVVVVLVQIVLHFWK